MASLENIIRGESEKAHLDFKAVQYAKEKHEDLIVDVVAMANTITSSARYIIIGVKVFANGQREILGINDQFRDEATYQQLIHQNVEPEIKIDYFSIVLDNKLIGVFHISECEDRPYMLKKDFNKLRKGDSWIRRGTFTDRLTRKDIDKFNVALNLQGDLAHNIEISSLINGKASEQIFRQLNLKLPSTVAREKITSVLQDKEEQIKRSPLMASLLDRDVLFFGGAPYEKRSISTLKSNLNSVKKDYREEDLYFLFEQNSNKLNFQLFNSATSYLEDASIIIEFDKVPGLLIATSVHAKPYNSTIEMLHGRTNLHNSLQVPYPSVTKEDGLFKVYENIGNVKHQIKTNAFESDLRVVISSKFQTDTLQMRVTILAKNLKKPFETMVVLKVVT